ncbi:hypothetical protein [uncultured Tateyamaria sp.]|uniref:hypothetical protein n=1 Tax=uncultured Tateyamaria sp. TaxID=455651 RepID=UPI00261DD9C7|nr:hypothetical protein [uncultured Tateyamaria sp.]
MTGREYLDEMSNAPGEGDVYIGFCLETKRETWASLSDARTHRIVIGTTGSGKTEELLAETCNALVHDSGVMMIDGKGEMKGSLKGVISLARLFWRDEDMYSLNYVMGGQDAQLFRHEKRSNTFNPLQKMGSSQMTEILISLLSAPGSDPMWSDRAIALIQGLIPPLNYLSGRGYIVLNAETLSRFLPLNAVEDLYWHCAFIDHGGKLVTLPQDEQDFLRQEYLTGLRIYLENIPGYTSGPPQPFMGRGNGPPPQADESRAEVVKQHGFLTMQIVKPITDLSFNYGYIYNTTIGEIDFLDMARNRRLLVGLLPALERSKQNMQPLGKMAVAAIKNTLATGLAGPVSGEWRQVMADQEVARGPTPYFILCDEYGYFVVEGFAVAPAQARSLGYSITFGVQNIDNLMEASEAEGNATQENTNIALVGRMTSGVESATYKFAASRAGEAHVQVIEDVELSYSGIGTTRLDDGRSRLQSLSRLSYDDMGAQKDGKFTFILGTPIFSRKGKRVITNQSVKVVRLLSLYCGGDYSPDSISPLNAAYVLPMAPDEKAKMRAELKLSGNPDLALKISATGQALMQERVNALTYDAFPQHVGPDDWLSYLSYRAEQRQAKLADYPDDETAALFDSYLGLVARLEQQSKQSGTMTMVQSDVQRKVGSPRFKAVLHDVVLDLARVRAEKSRERSRGRSAALSDVERQVEKAEATVEVKRIRTAV